MGKRLFVGAVLPLAKLGRAGAPLWRCFCLAWARAHLGCDAVPADNQFLGLVNFEGTCRIRFGRNCRVYKRVRLETRDNGEINIGDNVVLSPGTVIVAHERVTICNHALIGEYTSIRDQDHQVDAVVPTREAGYVTAPVWIGTDVWIGRGCAVLKGVRIGDRAIIGANSVVTREVPPEEVWFGAPARSHCGRSELKLT